MTAVYDRAQSLKALAEEKSTNTLAKVKYALSEMQKNNVPISFQAVAKYANVSKAWLYRNKTIAEEIRTNRSTLSKVRRLMDHDSQLEAKNKQIEILEKRISTMASEIESLKLQLESAFAELYKR